MGVTPTLITRPSGTSGPLWIEVDSGVFRLREGDYTGFVFVDGDITDADDTITETAHGLVTREGPFQVTTDDTLPTGLVVDTDYFIINVNANTIALALSEALALAGTRHAFAADGSGNHNLGGPAGWAPTVNPTATTSDGYGGASQGAGSAIPYSVIDKLTVVGFAASDALTFWFGP